MSKVVKKNGLNSRAVDSALPNSPEKEENSLCQMDDKRKRRFVICGSIVIVAFGVIAKLLLPTSEDEWLVLSVCFVIAISIFISGLLAGLSAKSPSTQVGRTSASHVINESPPPQVERISTSTVTESRADVVTRYLSSIKADDDVERKVRECLREIATSENWLEQAPSEWEDLWRWKKRVALSDELQAIERALRQQFRDRERELEQHELERDTEALWQAHQSTINKFFEIAERKVSILDDYGDEQWELLPKEIAACLRKISNAEREQITDEQLRAYRKNEPCGDIPKKYILITTRLKAAFIEYHEERHADRPDASLNELSGSEFETHVAHVLIAHGYEVSGTPATGDQGADLIAKKAGKTVVAQAKRYSGSVGNKAVQEVVGAVNFYGASEAWVVTNAVFTPAAKALAQKNNVRLIDGEEFAQLEKMRGPSCE